MIVRGQVTAYQHWATPRSDRVTCLTVTASLPSCWLTACVATPSPWWSVTMVVVID